MWQSEILDTRLTQVPRTNFTLLSSQHYKTNVELHISSETSRRSKRHRKSEVVVARLVPVFAAFFVLKAALDAAQGSSLLGSIIVAIFLLSISGTVRLMQNFNSGTEFATADMLVSIWNYLSGTVLPEAAGLAVVGAIINYSRKKPFMPLVFSSLAFLAVQLRCSRLQRYD